MHEESLDQKIIYVNTKRVGYLIGHHGRTIILFQQQSGAKIDIMTPNSRAKETPVKISGTCENVGRALRMILDLFSLDNYSSQYWQQMKDVKQSQAEQCNGSDKAIIGHEETRVPSYFAEFLRVSESIQKIENESGSRVIVMPESDVDTSFSIINVIGTADGNTKAFEILNERYREVEEANRLVPSSSTDQNEPNDLKSEDCPLNVIETCDDEPITNNVQMSKCHHDNSKQDVIINKSMAVIENNNDIKAIKEELCHNENMITLEKVEETTVDDNKSNVQINIKTESDSTIERNDKSNFEVKSNVYDDMESKPAEIDTVEHPFTNINQDQSFLDFAEKRKLAKGVKAVKGFLKNEFGFKMEYGKMANH